MTDETHDTDWHQHHPIVTRCHLCEYEEEIRSLRQKLVDVEQERDAYKVSANALKLVYQRLMEADS